MKCLAARSRPVFQILRAVILEKWCLIARVPGRWIFAYLFWHCVFYQRVGFELQICKCVSASRSLAFNSACSSASDANSIEISFTLSTLALFGKILQANFVLSLFEVLIYSSFFYKLTSRTIAQIFVSKMSNELQKVWVLNSNRHFQSILILSLNLIYILTLQISLSYFKDL